MCGKRAISLFSGAGGLDIGFEKAGFQIVLSNELDHDAACTWRANRPKSSASMRECDIKQLLPELIQYQDKIDVLFGGPPCQGFSVAGKMDPNDSRSELIFTFLKAVEIVKPTFFVMENVKGMQSVAEQVKVSETNIWRKPRPLVIPLNTLFFALPIMVFLKNVIVSFS